MARGRGAASRGLTGLQAKYLKDVLRLWDEGNYDSLFDVALDEVYKVTPRFRDGVLAHTQGVVFCRS